VNWKVILVSDVSFPTFHRSDWSKRGPPLSVHDTRKGAAGQIAVRSLHSVSRTFLKPALQAYTVLYSVFRVWERNTQCHPKGRRLGGFKKALQDRCTQGSQQMRVGGETTLTLHELITQRLIDHDRNDPTASLLSFLVWVLLYFFGMLKNDIYKLIGFVGHLSVFSQFGLSLSCTCLRVRWRACSTYFGICGVEVFNQQLCRQ